MSFEAAMKEAGRSGLLKMDQVMESMTDSDAAQLRKYLEDPEVPGGLIIKALKSDEFGVKVSRDAVSAWRRHNEVGE